MISPLTNVSKVPASGGGGGVTLTDVNNAITSANVQQDIVSMSTFASQTSLANVLNGTTAFTTVNANNVDLGASVTQLQTDVAGKADAASTTSALAGKVDNAALTNVNANIANLFAGGPLTELTVANPTYATVGDNTVDAFLSAKVDTNNTAGFRLRNTNHSAGSSTLSLDAWDTSLSVQQSAPVNALTLNYNADTGDKLLSTDAAAIGVVPSSTATGELYCQTLKASNGVTVGGVAVQTQIAGTPLCMQRFYFADFTSSVGAHATFGSATTKNTYLQVFTWHYVTKDATSTLLVDIHVPYSLAGTSNVGEYELSAHILGQGLIPEHNASLLTGLSVTSAGRTSGRLSPLHARITNIQAGGAVGIGIYVKLGSGATDTLTLHLDEAVIDLTEVKR